MKKQNKYLCLRADGTSDFVELPAEQLLGVQGSLDTACDALGCQYLYFAQTRISDLLLMVDAEQFFKTDCQINFVASDLYVGDMIAGDAILCRREGLELYPVSGEMLELIDSAFDIGLPSGFEGGAL